MTKENKQEWFRTGLQVAVLLVGVAFAWAKIEGRLTIIEDRLAAIAPMTAGVESMRVDLRLLELRVMMIEEKIKEDKHD